MQTLGEEVFSGCSSLESFTMPNSVQTLGERAFWGCSSLESLTLSNNLQSIPEYAFYACSDLGPDLNIPASVTEIGGTAFWHCEGIQNLTLNSGLQTIGGNAFEGCTGLEEVVIPNGVTTIGDNAFLTCSSLTEVSIPPSVSTIGDRAFFGVGAGCELNINSNGGEIALGTLALPNSNFKVNLTGSSIPMQAGGTTSLFNTYTNLTEIIVADTITSIPANAFNGTGSGVTITFESNQNISPCNLPSSAFNVVLKSGIPTNNGDTIFESAQTLQSVVFKGGQLAVNMAFSGCDNLTTVTFNSYPSAIALNIFPDDVAGIIFDPYPNDMNNVANVGNLLTPGRNFLTNPLTVTFKNNSTTRIKILEDAFNFAGAEDITYNFEAAPDHNMVYTNGNCFKSGTRIEYGGSYYDWDPTSKSWVQQ